MNYSITVPAEQVDTLKDLADSDMSMIVWPKFVVLHTISDKKVFDKIYDRAVNERTVIASSELLSNPIWITDNSFGRTPYSYAKYRFNNW